MATIISYPAIISFFLAALLFSFVIPAKSDKGWYILNSFLVLWLPPKADIYYTFFVAKNQEEICVIGAIRG